MAKITQKKKVVGKCKDKTKNTEVLNGDAGYRSPYLSHAKRALYHLSYIPFDEVSLTLKRSIIKTLEQNPNHHEMY